MLKYAEAIVGLLLTLNLTSGLHFNPNHPPAPSHLSAASVQKATTPPPPKEVFLGAFGFNGVAFAVMSTTVVIYDGKETPYFDVPDETTELVEISLDLRRRFVLKMVYVTRRDI